MISNSIIFLILYLTSITTDAAADATRDNGKKVISHALEAVSVLALLLTPIWYTGGIGWLLASYILLRIGLFDTVYNLLRKPSLHLCYHGKTGLWDKFVNLFKPYCWMELGTKALFAVTGAVMLIQNIK